MRSRLHRRSDYRGTHRRHRRSYWKAYLWVFANLTLSVIAFALYFRLEGVDRGLAFASEIVASPLPLLAEVEEQAQVSPEKDEIEAYIRTIFGKDARVAIAVSHNECSPQHRDYPSCVLHTQAEYSVGIFQINLYNERHWIHAAKVPGETMDQKIEWLKNPYHNTLVAYKIFKDSGFHPWTAYSSGNYLNDL